MAMRSLKSIAVSGEALVVFVESLVAGSAVGFGLGALVVSLAAVVTSVSVAIYHDLLLQGTMAGIGAVVGGIVGTVTLTRK